MDMISSTPPTDNTHNIQHFQHNIPQNVTNFPFTHFQQSVFVQPEKRQISGFQPILKKQKVEDDEKVKRIEKMKEEMFLTLSFSQENLLESSDLISPKIQNSQEGIQFGTSEMSQLSQLETPNISNLLNESNYQSFDLLK